MHVIQSYGDFLKKKSPEILRFNTSKVAMVTKRPASRRLTKPGGHADFQWGIPIPKMDGVGNGKSENNLW
jgi:hypothetical protein